MIFVGDRYCPKNLHRLHYFFLIWWISILQFLRKFFNFRVSPWNLHRHSLTKTITVDELHQLGSTNLETVFFKCCRPTYAHFFEKKGILNRMMGWVVLANPIVFVWAAYKLIVGRNCCENLGLTSIISGWPPSFRPITFKMIFILHVTSLGHRLPCPWWSFKSCAAAEGFGVDGKLSFPPGSCPGIPFLEVPKNRFRWFTERWQFYSLNFSERCARLSSWNPRQKFKDDFWWILFFMGANTAKRCVCVFLVFRSVASSFKDLVDQVHLVDQVPFWSWSGNLFVQLPKMMMMTLIPTTRWWHGKDFVGCCPKNWMKYLDLVSKSYQAKDHNITWQFLNPGPG